MATHAMFTEEERGQLHRVESLDECVAEEYQGITARQEILHVKDLPRGRG